MENIECVKYPLRLKAQKGRKWKFRLPNGNEQKTWEKVKKYGFLWRFRQENWAIYAVEWFHGFNIGWWEINEL